MSNDDSLHETVVNNYSTAKSISSLTRREEDEKTTPCFVSVTCLITSSVFLGSQATVSITELFLQTLFGKTGDRLASNSALKVNKHLQLEGYENIYAIGDCADLKEPKMAYHAGLHANVAVTNIINSLTHKPLKTYKPGKVICFPVGTAVKCAHIGTCAGHGLEVREPAAGVDCVSL